MFSGKPRICRKTVDFMYKKGGKGIVFFQESRYLFRFNPHLPLKITAQTVSGKAQDEIVTDQYK